MSRDPFPYEDLDWSEDWLEAEPAYHRHVRWQIRREAIDRLLVWACCAAFSIAIYVLLALALRAAYRAT